MGTLTPDELLRLYTLEKITVEMATGQLLQYLVRLYPLLERVAKLERELERLKAFVGMEEEKGRKKTTT